MPPSKLTRHFLALIFLKNFLSLFFYFFFIFFGISAKMKYHKLIKSIVQKLWSAVVIKILWLNELFYLVLGTRGSLPISTSFPDIQTCAVVLKKKIFSASFFFFILFSFNTISFYFFFFLNKISCKINLSITEPKWNKKNKIK